MPKVFKVIGCLATILVSLCGCMTLGPNYHRPTATVEPRWLEYEDPGLDSEAPVQPEWWRAAFNDPILDLLVETALAENLSLRSAGLRVLQARQQLLIAIGSQYPQQQQISGEAGVKGVASSPAYDIYELGFNLSWEADIWGRFQRQIESASAALDASMAAYDGVMVSLVAEIARTYLLILTTQQRIAVAEYNLDLQEESVRITTAKFDAGAVSSLDVEQARTLLYNTQATLDDLELSLQQLKNSLAVLLGGPSQDMVPLLGREQPVPVPDSALVVGMPQDLIRRRPDIRSAERQLAAQSAQIGFAITELYPHFGIGGSIGTSVSTAGTLEFSDLFSAETIGYGLFGFFQWNIFNYGRLKNNVRLQDAIFQQLLEDYREIVLQAQGEVENAIVAFLKSRRKLTAYELAARSAKLAVDISTVQYMDGLVDFNTVLSTLNSLTRQQDLLAAAQGAVATNLVDVYRSLGGGWEIRQAKTPLELIPEDTRKEMLERTDYWDDTFR